MSSNSEPFSLLSSARYDPDLLLADWNTRVNHGVPTPIMLLPYHVDRLAAAAKQHGWVESLHAISTKLVTAVCEEAVQKSGGDSSSGAAYKIRILLSRDGSLSATAAPLARTGSPRDLFTPIEEAGSIRTIYLDTEATSSSIFTTTKTTRRPHYNAARVRAGLSPAPTLSDAHIDVLLFTPDGQLTETSIRNIAFKRDGKWITPRASTGCLPGVFRQYMLEEGRWEEGELRLEDVEVDEIVMTANGVEGCYMGRILSFTG